MRKQQRLTATLSLLVLDAYRRGLPRMWSSHPKPISLPSHSHPTVATSAQSPKHKWLDLGYPERHHTNMGCRASKF